MHNNIIFILLNYRGTSFCTSTYRAFGLICGQILTLSMLNMISSFIMVVGKLFICGFCVSGAYIYMSQVPNEELDNRTIPLGKHVSYKFK